MRGKLARGASGPIGKLSRPRILRPRDPLTYVSAQAGPADRFGQSIGKSKNIFYQKGRPRITRKVSVRRLFRRDPYNAISADSSSIMGTGATVATFSKEADRMTNNDNPMYDPSQAPGSVAEISARNLSMEKPGKASRGHQKVIPYTTKTTQNAGKTLRRR